MKSIFFSVLFCVLFPWILACFEKQHLESNLQQYLAQEKNCWDTLFPEPPCCGISFDTPTSRIINGDMTGLYELNWAVSIDITMQNSTDSALKTFRCGGSLINFRWVLSAAHCFKLAEPEMIFIEAKVIFVEKDLTVKFRVEVEHISHPLFNLTGNLEYDLALLRLNEAVKYSEFAEPVCLPLTPMKPKCYENRKAVVTGWGQTSSLPNSASPVKLKAINTVWDANKRKEYAATHDVNMNDTYQIWASGGLSNAYYGDSGGPLNLKLRKYNNHYYLLGVVSHGILPKYNDTMLEPMYPKDYPTVFASIDIKWIADVILSKETK